MDIATINKRLVDVQRKFLKKGENIEDILSAIKRHIKSVESKNMGGRSGSDVYTVGKYFVKTILPKEYKIVSQLMNSYIPYVLQATDTYLPKILVIFIENDTYYFVSFNIMLFPRGIRYDLKGSIRNRTVITKKKTATLKDNNLRGKYFRFLNGNKFAKFYEMLFNDTFFLEQNRIMDYSLFINVGYRKPKKSVTNNSVFEVKEVPSKGKRAFVSIGIIDIFQEYDISKKIEGFLKGNTSSSINPIQYRKRFLNFMLRHMTTLDINPCTYSKLDCRASINCTYLQETGECIKKKGM